MKGASSLDSDGKPCLSLDNSFCPHVMVDHHLPHHLIAISWAWTPQIKPTISRCVRIFSQCSFPYSWWFFGGLYPIGIVYIAINIHDIIYIHLRCIMCVYIYVCVCMYVLYIIHTSSTAQGGGRSFRNRKPIGEVGCCDSRMAGRSHWWTERCLRSHLFLSFSGYLPAERGPLLFCQGFRSCDSSFCGRLFLLQAIVSTSGREPIWKNAMKFAASMHQFCSHRFATLICSHIKGCTTPQISIDAPRPHSAISAIALLNAAPQGCSPVRGFERCILRGCPSPNSAPWLCRARSM